MGQGQDVVRFATADEAIDFVRCNQEGYDCDVTGDACRGDEIIFVEDLYEGNWRRPVFAGCEVKRGKIVKDSYGEAKQQHTFTIEGPDGKKYLRKARNVYRNICLAKWRDQGERDEALCEKHCRGDVARAEREERRVEEGYYYKHL